MILIGSVGQYDLEDFGSPGLTPPLRCTDGVLVATDYGSKFIG